MQDEEDVLLQGEKEAEKMIVEAYSALLLAFLSTERFCTLMMLVISQSIDFIFFQLLIFLCLSFSTDIRSAISNCLPDHKLSILVPVLERFVVSRLSVKILLVWHKYYRITIKSIMILFL